MNRDLKIKSDENKPEYMGANMPMNKVCANSQHSQAAETGSLYIVAHTCGLENEGTRRIFTVPSNLTTKEVKLRCREELGLSADIPISLTHDGIVIPENRALNQRNFR